MASKLVLIAGLAVFVSFITPDSLLAQTSEAALTAVEVSRIKAQEFSRTLAQLKIQEVVLQRATPVDNQALALNRAQQSALDDELTHIAAEPVKLEIQRLEAERQMLANELRPKHPKMVALQAEIDRAKATLVDGK